MNVDTLVARPLDPVVSRVSWITTVARSRALDHLRRRAANPRGENESDDSQGWVRATDELVQLEVSSARVAMALEKLPHEQRTAIEMSFYHGLTASEIAAEVGVPIGTVKTRLRLALYKLASACNATLEDCVEETSQRRVAPPPALDPENLACRALTGAQVGAGSALRAKRRW